MVFIVPHLLFGTINNEKYLTKVLEYFDFGKGEKLNYSNNIFEKLKVWKVYSPNSTISLDLHF